VRSNRLAGHTLPYEGRVFDARDPRINRLVNGPGRAQCSCGEWSPDMPSTNARRKWHRAHKADVGRIAGDEYADDLRELATRVNGFVYPGDRLNAVVDAVRELRADPDLAARLLAPYEVRRSGTGEGENRG